jgi:hypothetical protein
MFPGSSLDLLEDLLALHRQSVTIKKSPDRNIADDRHRVEELDVHSNNSEQPGHRELLTFREAQPLVCFCIHDTNSELFCHYSHLVSTSRTMKTVNIFITLFAERHP